MGIEIDSGNSLPCKCVAQKKVPSFRKLAVIFHENNSLFLFNSASTGPILYIFGNKASN